MTHSFSPQRVRKIWFNSFVLFLFISFFFKTDKIITTSKIYDAFFILKRRETKKLNGDVWLQTKQVKEICQELFEVPACSYAERKLFLMLTKTIEWQFNAASACRFVFPMLKNNSFYNPHHAENIHNTWYIDSFTVLTMKYNKSWQLFSPDNFLSQYI